MAADHSQNAPIVHLAIDIQKEYIEKLTEPFKSSFLASAEQFANALEQRGVPTIRVAFGIDEDKFVVRSDNSQADLLRYELEFPVDDKSLILVKSTKNAFYKSVLADYLNEHGMTSIVVTGVNTRLCVADTLFGGQLAQFQCYAITDRMADIRDSFTPRPQLPEPYNIPGVIDVIGNIYTEESRNDDPSWHNRTLKTILEEYSRNFENIHGILDITCPQVIFCGADDFLASYENKTLLAATRRQTSLQHLQQAGFSKYLAECALASPSQPVRSQSGGARIITPGQPGGVH